MAAESDPNVGGTRSFGSVTRQGHITHEIPQSARRVGGKRGVGSADQLIRAVPWQEFGETDPDRTFVANGSELSLDRVEALPGTFDGCALHRADELVAADARDQVI